VNGAGAGVEGLTRASKDGGGKGARANFAGGGGQARNLSQIRKGRKLSSIDPLEVVSDSRIRVSAP
jgi:hypothetical protein